MSEIVYGTSAKKLPNEDGVKDEIQQDKTKANMIKDVNIGGKKFKIASYQINGKIEFAVFDPEKEKKKIATYNFKESRLEVKDGFDISDGEKSLLTDEIQKEYQNSLINLSNLINLSGKDRPLISLATEIDDRSTLYTELQLEESGMENRIPDGISISSFKDGFLTFIEPSELPEGIYIEHPDAKRIPIITTKSGNHIYTLDDKNLEWTGNDSQGLINERQKNTVASNEFGEIDTPPANNMENTEYARFKLKKARDGEEQKFLSVRESEQHRKNSILEHGASIEEVWIERMSLSVGQSEHSLNTGLGGTIYAEELKSYGTPDSVLESARVHREELSSPDDARLEVYEEYSRIAARTLKKAISESEYQVQIRGDEELNMQMKQEVEKRAIEMAKQGKKSDEIMAAITDNANEVVNYWEMANNLAKSSNYTAKEIFNEILKQKEEKPNKEVDVNKVVDDLESQKVPGIGYDPRHVS